ncbi:S53 family peptidase [Aquabacterium sp.]|uniref:S53 family peptidase n=1 Tax=Aquabacterium sp. TaxID=1872578 RepID=UPI0035B2673D
MKSKPLQRISSLATRHPLVALVTLAGAIAVIGVSFGEEHDSARPAPVQTSRPGGALSSVNPQTVSPFTALPMPTRFEQSAQAGYQQQAVVSAEPAWSGATTSTPRSLAAMWGIQSGEETDARRDHPVVAPADLQPVQPPRLYVASVPTPGDIDADGQKASAALPPTQVQVSLDTVSKGGGVAAASRDSAGAGVVNLGGLGLNPAAGAATVSVYTPAQIRQAYGFAALPDGTLANKSVYQGAGQIIVILDAFHHATAGVDLNTFSAKFGLPACTLLPTVYQPKVAISALVSKPAAGNGCTFQTLYVNSAGAQAANPPAVNAAWAVEIALDVQWAHAMAPKAKIVLVEAASASGNDLMNAMLFASKLGARTVSMSFGAPEFSSAPTFDWVMGGAGVTWVAATGDNGAGVSWPASSRNVLAVGGTQLNNVSPRAEVGWSGSGGGRSAYVVMPAWQSSVSIVGNPANTLANAAKMRRGVPDVAYNASPYSGFYVYMSGKGYLSVGGTSAGTPQWAALVSIIDGVRALAGKPVFSGTAFQQALYGTAASTAIYKAAWLDVSSGTNGKCGAGCSASINYDLVTGLGTPNVVSLLGTMAGI